MPAEISSVEIETVSRVANAVRAGRAPFVGSFELVGEVVALPLIENGEDIEIGETWVVEIFGEEVELGRRSVHFHPSVVRRGELVEPGRQVVEIEPAPLAGEEELWWVLARPR